MDHGAAPFTKSVLGVLLELTAAEAHHARSPYVLPGSGAAAATPAEARAMRGGKAAAGARRSRGAGPRHSTAEVQEVKDIDLLGTLALQWQGRGCRVLLAPSEELGWGCDVDQGSSATSKRSGAAPAVSGGISAAAELLRCVTGQAVVVVAQSSWDDACRAGGDAPQELLRNLLECAAGAHS
jgi:hypothetical protein